LVEKKGGGDSLSTFGGMSGEKKRGERGTILLRRGERAKKREFRSPFTGEMRRKIREVRRAAGVLGFTIIGKGGGRKSDTRVPITRLNNNGGCVQQERRKKHKTGGILHD